MGNFNVVDDDEILAKQLGVYQATWMKNSGQDNLAFPQNQSYHVPFPIARMSTKGGQD